MIDLTGREIDSMYHWWGFGCEGSLEDISQPEWRKEKMTETVGLYRSFTLFLEGWRIPKLSRRMKLYVRGKCSEELAWIEFEIQIQMNLRLKFKFQFNQMETGSEF